MSRPPPQTVTDTLTSNTNMTWGRKLFKWVASGLKGRNTNYINNNPFNITSIFSPPCLQCTAINFANFWRNRMMLSLSRSQKLTVWDSLPRHCWLVRKKKKKCHLIKPKHRFLYYKVRHALTHVLGRQTALDSTFRNIENLVYICLGLQMPLYHF